MAYAPGDPNTPSALRTRANGWIGSRYVGTAGAGAAPQAPVVPTHTPNPSLNQPLAVDPAITQADANRQYEQDNPNYVNALQNYWAPDREDELARQRAASTQPQGATPPGTPPTTTGAGPSSTSVTSLWTAPTGARAQGFDAGKLGNTELGTSHKYIGGRFLLSGGTIPAMLQKPEFAGWTQVGPDKIRGPAGSVYDVRNANGAVQWTAISGPAHDRNGIPGVGPQGSSGLEALRHDGIKGNYEAATRGIATPSTDPFDQQLIDELLQRSHQSLDVNAANSPAIRAQSDPYRAQVERQSRDYLADIAEKSGPNANMRGEQRLASEHAGQAIGLNESRLVGLEVDARRQEIQDALNERGRLMTESQRQALTRELAALSDATQRLGISTGAATTQRGQDLNNDQFLRDLGLRAGDRDNYWDAINRGLLG